MIVPGRRSRIFSMVLAGGEGSRLQPLTRDRAKPAVAFGGKYRLIDFALSNLVNGGFRKIAVLTQYKSHSLNVHISRTWRMSTLLGLYVTSVPAQMRLGKRWFVGSADAVYQNMNLIDDEDPDHIFVFGADHIYRMEPGQMLDFHAGAGAEVTVAVIRVPIEQAHAFGVVEADASGKIIGFVEKPADPKPTADDPTMALVSMGNYVFTAEALRAQVALDADDADSRHDIGGNLIPRMVESGVAYAYDFTFNDVPGATERDKGYWRDVGTIDSYFEAHMDLVSVDPVFNLYNMEWPIYTADVTGPPAKVVAVAEHGAGRLTDSMLSTGVVLSGAYVTSSVLSPFVRVEAGATLDGAILFDDVHVGEGARLRNVIIDKGVDVPPGAVIGYDAQRDRERFTVSRNGVVAIPKGEVIKEPI